MDIKVKDKVNQRHVGRNLQRIRVYLGMKQEALASDLGVSQQEISKIEKPFVILIIIKMLPFLREQLLLFMLITNRLILLKRWLNCMNAC